MSEVVSRPRLFLLSQTGKEEKVFCEDGSQRSYRNVAKNGVFTIVIGQTTKGNPPGTQLIDFKNIGVLCTLVYDQNRQKPVEVISQKPMEYKLSSLQNGSELRVDARIKVLSSQFEGSLFCVSIQFVDGNRNVIPELSLFSQPIRVRSKIKPLPGTTYGNVLDTPSSSVYSPQKRNLSQIVGIPAKRGRKRVLNPVDTTSPIKSEVCDDDVVDISCMPAMARVLQALDRIETRQIQQQAYMDNLAKKPAVLHSSPSSCESPDDLQCDFPTGNQLASPSAGSSCQCVPPEAQPEFSFANQFLQLMTAYSLMSDTERQKQLGLIQNYANGKQHHAMESIVSSLLQPSLQSAQSLPSSFEGSPYEVDDGSDSSSYNFF